jgi:glutamate---cysteine ligase / carboxylate-amine ligase
MAGGHAMILPDMRFTRSRFAGLDALPEWSRWNGARERRYTVGAEEELMLLERDGSSLAQESERVLARLPAGLAEHVLPETHAAVVELATGVHGDVAGTVAELAGLRARLARELRAMELGAACAGTFPLASAQATRISRLERYRVIADSMRTLARREPTLALHVHVGVPDCEDAIRVINGMRDVVPLLLALSANSPFCQGRDTGFASTRTVIFQGFPRTGTARRFAGYADYARSVDALIASGALPDSSFLWWDVRLQPRLGTVEVRAMDAQSTVADSGALIALVMSVARAELEEDPRPGTVTPEVLAENRFIAARDGLDAHLIDPERSRLVPVRDLVEELLARCAPHAAALGCASELEHVRALAKEGGAARQRRHADAEGLDEVVPALMGSFTETSGIVPHPQSKRSP